MNMTVDTARTTFVLELMVVMTVAIAVGACGVIIAFAAFRRAEGGAAARILGSMVNRTGLLQLLTVVVIVHSVLILRVFEGLSADATVSVLSGIAGYVLGGLTGAQAVSGHDQDRPAISK
jgi:hypothetical protein